MKKTNNKIKIDLSNFIMSFSEENQDKNIQINSLNMVSETENSHYAIIKLKPEEARRALDCQKVMLNFAKKRFRESIGTEKEEEMRKMYKDAIMDCRLFLMQHKNEF